MWIAYLDCFAGISGDMLLGALLDAGVPQQVLDETVAALGLNATLKMERVDRSGISAIKAHVLEGNRLAEEIEQEVQILTLAHEHPHIHPHPQQHDRGGEDDFPQVHGRNLVEIRHLIASAMLGAEVKRRAIETFELLGAAEAKVHNVPPETIHFHEVGGVDAIVDIVAACAGMAHLEATYGGLRWYCSPINVGNGTVRCAHGLFPVPAPAVVNLLRGVPTYSAHVQKELTTPTGAALLRMLNPVYGPQPPMQVLTIGYGAGTRNPQHFPNVVRLLLGEATESVRTDEVVVLETALDDATPQLIAAVAEQAMALGALDVMLTPVTMKKGRPGTLMTVLCEPARRGQMEQLLLRETTTLGVRTRVEERRILDRRHVTVSTRFGEIRVKLGVLGDEVLNAQPEYEDCKACSSVTGASLKEVTQAAIAAYYASRGKAQ